MLETLVLLLAFGFLSFSMLLVSPFMPTKKLQVVLFIAGIVGSILTIWVVLRIPLLEGL